jgi:hypothetical protein
VSRAHPDIGPELRRLAQSILDGIDPAVRAAVAMTGGGGVDTGKCQQVWCPVCALAALATGDQHPLLTIVADHSIGLLEVIRAIISDVNDADRSAKPGPKPPPDDPPDPPDPSGPAGPAKTRYQPIPVSVDE